MRHFKFLSTIGFCIALAAGTWLVFAHSSALTLQPESTFSKWTEYTDDVFNFRVSYPTAYAVREYVEDEEGARTVAFEGPSPGEGFQVFVVPYAGNSITPERFKTDDPSGVMKDATEIMVDGAPANSFFGYNDQMGDTREVWFIHGGYLHEVTTYTNPPID